MTAYNFIPPVSARFFTEMMTQEEPIEQQWAEQQDAEWRKEAANRAALLESLIIQKDWQSCRRWIELWECEASEVSHLLRWLHPTDRDKRIDRN